MKVSKEVRRRIMAKPNLYDLFGCCPNLDGDRPNLDGGRPNLNSNLESYCPNLNYDRPNLHGCRLVLNVACSLKLDDGSPKLHVVVRIWLLIVRIWMANMRI